MLLQHETTISDKNAADEIFLSDHTIMTFRTAAACVEAELNQIQSPRYNVCQEIDLIVDTEIGQLYSAKGGEFRSRTRACIDCLHARQKVETDPKRA